MNMLNNDQEEVVKLLDEEESAVILSHAEKTQVRLQDSWSCWPEDTQMILTDIIAQVSLGTDQSHRTDTYLRGKILTQKL